MKKYCCKKFVSTKNYKNNVSFYDKTPKKPNYAYNEIEWSSVLNKIANYEDSYERLKINAINVLGFDYEEAFCVPKKMKLCNLKFVDGSKRQKCAIPLKQSVVDYLLNIEKKFLFEENTKKVVDGKTLNSNCQFYVADSKYGVLAFAFIIVDKHNKNALVGESKRTHSMSLYLLINGKEYFEMCRYDAKNSVHYNRFEIDSGVLCRESSKISGPHIHKYNEKFLVLFPNSFCHYDAETLPIADKTKKEQIEFVKGMLNLEKSKTKEYNIYKTRLRELFD